MATSITSLQGQAVHGLAGVRQLDSDSALRVLNQIQTQINGKSGVLKLMHTQSQRPGQAMVFERKSWYQAIARRDSKMADTAQALQNLYQQAGLSPAAQNQLKLYLQKHGNRVGGRGLATLMQDHLVQGTSERLVKQVLPKEGNNNLLLGDQLFGTRDERRAPSTGPGLARISQLQRQWGLNLDPRYVIPAGGRHTTELVGISRSANAQGGAALDTSQPIVIFFGGSHGHVHDYGYPAAEAAGPGVAGGLNFLAVDYRGFGASGHGNPTPKSITDDAMRVYEHVKGLGFRPDQIILRGYSLGAAAAGRVHAHAQLMGEQLMGVVYDRPMASAPDRAAVDFGWLGKQGAKGAVGQFGAERYLDVVRDKGPSEKCPVYVVADNEPELGPRAMQMAAERQLPLMRLAEAQFPGFRDPDQPVLGGHEDHASANQAVGAWLERLVQGGV